MAGMRAVAVDGAACQREDRRVMTAALPESQETGGVWSLEVRWIFRGERGSGGVPGCAVELTDVHAAGRAWWTLGFEATGPPDVLRGELDAAAALVFALALPGGLELGVGDSRSYAAWLRRQPRVPRSPEPEGDPVADV